MKQVFPKFVRLFEQYTLHGYHGGHCDIGETMGIDNYCSVIVSFKYMQSMPHTVIAQYSFTFIKLKEILTLYKAGFSLFIGVSWSIRAAWAPR